LQNKKDIHPLDERELNKVYLGKVAPAINCLKSEECSRRAFESAGFFYRLFDEDYKEFVADYKLNEFDAFSYDVFNNFQIENEFFSFIFTGKNNRKWLIKLELWGEKVKLGAVNRVL